MRKNLLLFVLITLMGFAGINAQNRNVLSIPDFTVANASEIVLPVDMENTSDIVAVQFTVQLPQGFSLDAASARLNQSRAGDHSLTFRSIGNNRYMCMINSVRNKVISGNNGLLLTVPLKYTLQNYPNTCPVAFTDVVLALADGTDVITDVHSGNVTFRHLTGNAVCSGTESGAEDFYLLSSLFDYNWSLKDRPQSIEGYIEKGKAVIPPMELVNDGVGAEILKYNVTASYGGTAIYNFEYNIPVRPSLIGAFFNYSPRNESVVPSNAIDLSWNNIINALYDIYIWKSGENMPQTPLLSDISSTTVNVNQYCTFGETYNWRVVAHNECQEIESDIQSFTVRDLPDLHVTRVDCSDPVAGEKMTVEWTVSNDGVGSTGDAEWNDYIWLVPDMWLGTSTTGCKLLKTVGNVKSLESGESYINQYEVQLDERIYGKYNILVTSDMYNVTDIAWQTDIPVYPYTPATTGYLTAKSTASGKLSEYNVGGRRDNFFYTQIDIAIPPLPDLQIPNITVLKDGIPASEFFGGTSVDVVVTIQNKGEAAIVNKSVHNQLHRSNADYHEDAELTFLSSSYKTLNLAPGESCEERYTVKIPERYYGDLYFHAETDVNDNVFELANTENNWGASEKINVMVLPGADLQPASVSVNAAKVTANQSITVSYTAVNTGAGKPDATKWRDGIYLCQNPERLTPPYFHLATVPVSYTTDKYSNEVSVTLGSLEGTYYIYVVTDDNDDIFEYEGEENNVLRSDKPVTFEELDLSVELCKIYNDVIKSGEEVSFEWKLKNTGSGDILKTRIADTFYASASENGADAFCLGTIYNDVWIPEGGEKVLRGKLHVPYGKNADAVQYIFITTDADNVLVEKTEGNNTSNKIQHQCDFLYRPLSNLPDLTVAGLSAPDMSVTSDYITVNWTCANNGLTDAGAFNTSVYLSDDASFSKKDVLVSSNTITSLAAGSTTDVQSIIFLKDEYYSKKYLIVTVDDFNNIREADEGNNYAVRPISLTLSLEPQKLPNLSISFLKAPEPIETSCYSTINWSCTNSGLSDAGAFNNGIYLSEDAIWSEDDILLATQCTSTLRNGTGIDYQTHIYIPDEYSDYSYLVLRADINDVIDESDKSDNARAVSVNIIKGEKPEPGIPDPDNSPNLTVSGLSLRNSSVTTSSDLTLNWTCANNGTADAPSSMAGIYVSSDAVLDAGDRLLATQFITLMRKDNPISYQSSINIPDTYQGNAYIIVCADINNTVNELDETDNAGNLAVSIVRRQPGRSANLVAEAADVPASVNATVAFATKWKVTDSGTVDAGTFFSSLYLSDDAVWSSDDAVLATNVTPSLAAGAAADYNFSVTIPQTDTGKRYLIFRTDIYNTVRENSKSDNFVICPIIVGSSPSEKKYPDLSVTDVVLPEDITTSKEFTIEWTVANNGQADASSFYNDIYLSDDAKYSGGDIQLASERVTSLKLGDKVVFKTTLSVADRYHGNKYLIFHTNMYSQTPERETSDNIKAVPVTIACGPVPNLAVKSVGCVEELTQGQEITVKATIVNNGEVETPQNRWVTEYYLCPDAVFSKDKAYRIGSSTHNGILKPGEEQTDSTVLTLPQDISGNFMLYANTDATDAVCESDESDNLSKWRFVSIYPVEERPVNLVTEKLSAPVSLTAGDNITISYKVTNTGQFAANGTLRDVIYLSKDNKWDYNDIQVGVVTGSVKIEAGQDIVREATGRVVNVPEGKYFFIVKTNSTHSIPEVDYEDNTSISRIASQVAFRTLQLGGSENVSVCGYYKIDVGSMSGSQTVGFNLEHPEDTQAGLYVSYESVPSTAVYDFASFALSNERHSVILPVANAGRYYILAQDNSSLVNNNGYTFSLDGGSEFSGADMTLSASEVHFGAASLSITEGGTDGWITTEIKGAMFDSIMDFRLAAESGVIPAEHVVFRDQTSSGVTFNLRNADVGVYDVVSELPDGTRAVLPDGFHVIPGVKCDLGIKIDAPHVVHSGSHSPVSLAFANGGTNDIQIKEILVKMSGAYLGKSIEDFKNASSELHLVPEGYEIDRYGYITIAPGTQKVINFFMEQHSGTSHMSVYIVK